MNTWLLHHFAVTALFHKVGLFEIFNDSLLESTDSSTTLWGILGVKSESCSFALVPLVLVVVYMGRLVVALPMIMSILGWGTCIISLLCWTLG